MPRLALFTDRISAHPQLHVIECTNCDWYVEYFAFTNRDIAHQGDQIGADVEVALHAHLAGHGAARVVACRRP
jgi:hypothetical protein